jgi:methyl-accepting chemotaxis protein
MKKMTLGTKMTVGGIAFVVLPLLVVGILAYSRASKGLTELAYGRAGVIAQNLAEMTQLALLEELKIAKELAVGETLIKTGEKVGEVGAAAAQEDIKVLTARLVRSHKALGDDYEAIIVTDASGKGYADSINGAFVGVDLSDRDYFKKASGGQANVGNVVKSRQSGKPVLVAAAPILNSAGRFLGVLGLVQKTDFLVDRIVSIKIGNTGYPWMVDPTGLVIAHPKKEYILELNLKTDTGGGMDSIMNKMLAGQSGVEAYLFKGVDKICGFAPVPLAGWSLGATQDTEEFMGPVVSIRNGILIVGGVALVVAVVLVWFMAKGISKSIMKSVEEISEAADQVSSASAELSSAAQELAEGASEQAATVEETSASLEEMTAMAKQTSELTSSAGLLMKDNIIKSEQSLAAIVDVTKQMTQVEADSGQMGKIIKTIDEIAFQTNLLALNAAVEAARAGDAGQGFAVVADEVRNLAQRAAEAAKNTQELLDGTIKRVGQAALAVKGINTNFEGIVESATSMGQKIEAINSATNEQTKGIEQITVAANQIDKVTQRTAATAEESAAASEELNAQADTLRESVVTLAEVVGGGVEQPSRHRQPPRRPAAKPLPARPMSARPMPAKKQLGRGPGVTSPAQARPTQQVAKADDTFPMDDDDF